MSKSPTQTGTNTTTTTNAPPQYVQDAQKALMAIGANLTSPFVGNAPNYALAGFTPDQQMAFDLARYQGQQAFTSNPINLSDYGSTSANAASASPAANISAAQLGPASMAQASQLNGADIRNFFNPYQTDVANTTIQQLEEANARQLAAIRARQAAEGAYGGNRGALQSSEQNRNFGNTLASTIAGLYQSGWNNAANLGMGNTQLRQQTGLSNQAAQNSFEQLQAQLQQQAAMQNAANQQQANLANAGYQQQANMFNAQQPLAAAALQNQLNQTTWQQQMQALQALLGTGGQQQQFAQSALNVPYTAMNQLAGIVPSQYGSSGTSSQPIYGPSTFQTLASLAPLGIAAAGAFGSSDRSLKTDIQKLGKDPKTNLDMYAYRYKGDPKNTMKVVGPMADDVEKKYPGSTQKVGGKLAIKGSARQLLGI